MKINLYNGFFKFIAVIFIIAGMSAITLNISNQGSLESVAVFIEGESYYNSKVYYDTQEIADMIGPLKFSEKNSEGGWNYYPDDEARASMQANLDEYLKKGYRYLVTSDGRTVLEDGIIPGISPQSNLESRYIVNEFGQSYMENGAYKDVTIKVAVPKQMLTEQGYHMNPDSPEGRIIFYSTVAGIGAILAGALWLMIFAGQGKKGDDVSIRLYDRVYFDILLVITFFAELGFGAGFILLYQGIIDKAANEEVIITLLWLLSALFVIYNIYFVTNFAKRIKRKELLRYTLVFRSLAWMKSLFRAVLEFFRIRAMNIRTAINSLMGEKLSKRYTRWIILVMAVLLINLVFSAAGGPLWAIVTYPVIVFYLLKPAAKEIKDFSQMAKGVRELRNGNLGQKIPFASCRELSEVIDDINNIAEGFDKAVQGAVKAEKMKSELITNVSHDLKTPLTSIIGYVDLLEGTEGMPAEARDYIAVIKKKSYRLKNIISDLFDLSKSTSGNFELEMEKLDMKKLIEQTLADMSDSIETSGRTIRQSLPENPLMILGDGKKLYRVFQNVIDNAIKYSMDNTRIFINLYEKDNRAFAEIKNIAAYELDFSETEITERFTRGDKNRATEGNGLGLSIAKSFTNACNGDFRVTIDGDQFKVTIEFNTLRENM
ncbi:sensor histidine kinase [Proteocatella sphenisci]|uniref:sensor histidine kinase n=1 Tax=Proteocatella sphenisci TaxID=181070 RepID=UPI0012EB7F6B|nr:HAMP domain-containing sensor histidine kinase [Proteocatella sphenisci]